MLSLAFHLGPFAFEQPKWLLLAPLCWILAIWIGRKSLSGMGTWTRRAALIIRLLVILLIAAAIARPQWRKEGLGVNVSLILDQSDSVRRPQKLPDGTMQDLLTRVNNFIDDAADTATPDDTVSRVTVARKAYVQSLPLPPHDKPDSIFTGATDGTNLADGLTLSMATMPSTSANRALVVSDGNQTAGDILSAANAAKAKNIPVDVLPIRYKFEHEVMVERVVAPSTARMGQNVNLRVVINSTAPASGRLSLLINDDPVKLGSSESKDDMAMPVVLDTGTNVFTIPISLPLPGPQRFYAHFTPDKPEYDSIAQNNSALAVTFVQSEGRVLILAPSPEEVQGLADILTQSRLAVDIKTPTFAPKSLVDWGAYDAVVMVNTPVFEFNQQQQEDMRSYVHDLGGGLVMVGGPESFGAGGWLGSPTADALPVKLDPPQKRQMPRGALVLIMHSCEMPRGNYWGQQVALAAVNNLSRLDLAGILEYSFANGDTWTYPLTEVGSKAAITRAINSLTYGDMPSFDALLQKAYNGLVKCDAGAKHMILISDGDPQLLNRGLLGQCKAANISISTVLVYPHNRAASGGYDWQTMKEIADKTGGKFYPIIDEGEFAKLPSIFIKEAQVVKRALIWEGDAFQPAVTNAFSEPMRGIGNGVPSISGYIVAGEREGLSVVTLRGKENDPLLAHWQYGLGKSVAFTSDVGTRWAKSWPGWARFRPFWEQHIRWAMRPSGNTDIRVVTEDLGDSTKLVVEALDPKGERLNFVRFAGRAVGPDGKAQSVELRQVGPGRYEGLFDSAGSGAYVVNLRYSAPGEGGQAKEGNVQAAITRPYADEYRELEDNFALLKLLAERTGGRVLDWDPKTANLWSHDGLPKPVSLRPIWMTIAMVALGVFLLDVAVRRVRIDPYAIAAAVRRGFGQSVSTANQQLGSLKQARGRAQDRTGGQSQADVPKPAPDAQTAAAKFEVSEEELKRSKTLSADARADAPAAGPASPQQSAKPADPGEEQGLSRLKKARQRAQDKFDDQNPENPQT